MLPFALPKKATPEDARKKAGYTKWQWDRFYRLTKSEAKMVHQKHPDWTWPAVPVEEKEEMMKRVNAELAAWNIPEVGEDVFGWRMSLAIRDCRHTAGSRTRHASQSTDAHSETGQPAASQDSTPARNAGETVRRLQEGSLWPIRKMSKLRKSGLGH
ncbi:hypothetical protein BU26DRAFT_79051 [Trematosphaeria pertusa]|uniref:Uncharacterized protein n=1 Tax=Trematosphaeria pertusa TaxID=390896 RepID=A0A6A6I412_9PLEO|nr:uncharacterized protein BU26DRAFT_79051 [Trematosphaeria pertusa]KAF2245234.1 hypothetical protein BU26DRAFT_79051 [Trematosphaeria pertusa]